MWSRSRAAGVSSSSTAARNGHVSTEERRDGAAKLLGAERLVLEERELPPVERLGEVLVRIGEREPAEQLGRDATTELVQPGRLTGRLRSRDREHGPDPVRSPVEGLEQDRAGGERRCGGQSNRADRVGQLGGGVRDVLADAKRLAELEHAEAVGLPAEPRRQQPSRLGPMPGELAIRGGTDPETRCELAEGADREPDERCDRRVRAAFPEQRALELRIGTLERIVVPVEAPARLGDAEQQVDEHRPEQRFVL